MDNDLEVVDKREFEVLITRMSMSLFKEEKKHEHNLQSIPKIARVDEL